MHHCGVFLYIIKGEISYLYASQYATEYQKF